MLFKTHGIVLNHIKFKESSIIVKIFTAKFGVQSYLVNSVRSVKSKPKMAYFIPLTPLELVVYKNDKKDIQRISEYKLAYSFTEIPFQATKTTLALFLSEIIYKTVSNEEDQEELFEFFFNYIQILDQSEKIGDFHLHFLMEYSKYLGIYADAIEIEKQVIKWQVLQPIELVQLKNGLSLIESENDPSKVLLNKNERKIVLEALIIFYKKNIPSLQFLESYEILKSVFQ